MNEQPSKIYLLPNLMTAGNLFCGFTATLKILEGALLQASNPDAAGDLFHTAIWFVLGAFVFDFLDGRLARLGWTRESVRPRVRFARGYCFVRPCAGVDGLPSRVAGVSARLLDHRVYLSGLRRAAPGPFQFSAARSTTEPVTKTLSPVFPFPPLPV